MDKVVHFEITFDDQQRAKEFYGSVFDWDLDDNDMGKEPGAIYGGFTRRGSETPYPVITIGVDAIDDTLKKVEAGGGSTITPRTPIPNLGAFAYFKDSEGNVMGLWETM